LSAEDCALFKALSEGQNQIKAICVHVKQAVREDQNIISPNQGSLMNQQNPHIISPRLNQSLMQPDIYNVPELKWQSSS